MRSSIRTFAAILAIAALLFALALPANADLLCVLLVAFSLIATPLVERRGLTVLFAVAQPLSLRPALPARAPPRP